MDFPKVGPSKRKRVVLTLQQKIEICHRLERGENRMNIMNEFKIGSSTIYDIKSQKDKLLKFYSSSETPKSVEKRRTLRKPKLEELDTVLYEWFSLKRSEGVPISGPMLIEKAKDFYAKMELTDKCAFSEGWLTRFKLRHGIRRLDISINPLRNLSESDIEQWVDADREVGVVHVLSDDEIIETVLNPRKEKESEEDEIYEEKMISWAKAADGFDVILQFAEGQPCYSAQEVMQLHILHSTFLQKRQESIKQADIRNMFKKASKRVQAVEVPDESVEVKVHDPDDPAGMDIPNEPADLE